MVLKFRGNGGAGLWGMRWAHRIPVPSALSLGASHWLRHPAGHLAEQPRPAALDAETTPGQRPGFNRIRVPPPCGSPCGYGFAALYMWRAANGRLPRGFVFGGALHRSLVFSMTPWLFLQKCCRVPPRLLRVSIKDAALHYVSCLARLLQTLPAHSRRPPSPHLAGQELIEKRGTTKLKHRRNQKFCGAEIFRIRVLLKSKTKGRT